MFKKSILAVSLALGAVATVQAVPFHFFGVSPTAEKVNFRAYLSVHGLYEESARMGKTADGGYESGFNVDTEASMLGVNGRVQAADDFDFIYNVDYGLDFHTHDSTMGVNKSGIVHRNQWLGLDSKQYGQLRMGRDDAFHFYVNTIGAERFFSTYGAGKFIHKNNRYHGNVATYFTPMMSGFKLGAQYFGAKDNHGGGQDYYVNEEGSKVDQNGAAALVYYNYGGINLAASYDYRVEGSDGVRVGGNYTANGARIGFTWSQFDQRVLKSEVATLGTSELQDLDTWAASVEYFFTPEWRVYAQYGHANNGYWTSLPAHGIKRPELFGVEVDQYNLALERKFSNRTAISPEITYYQFGDRNGYGMATNLDDELFIGVRLNLILM
ncbi:porin [Shewanella sp. GXUN23E]|uniref:porin n=1 Tax=Shewanella sp. GXUN23E TaxID=3422498 RepID=UPI003D7D190A